MSAPRTGMVLGKFLPPHTGHLHLVDFARGWVDQLHVVVGTLPGEPIAGTLRHQWMRELCPGANVVHLTDENPQHPDEHPRFWEIWRDSLLRVLPAPPQLVFASEAYGARLAGVLGAEWIPGDLAREAVPISATRIRADPLGSWRFLPPCVRAHYAVRVCIFGPESTGKTTLARALASHYRTAWVPEYARTLLESRGDAITTAVMERIARGQRAAEDAAARRAHHVLVCDTDPLATVIWSETLLGACPRAVRDIADERACDLYLVTDVDVPWIADPVRYLPEDRAGFRDRCVAALQARGRRYQLLRGAHTDRLATAIAAIDGLMADRRPSASERR